MNIHEALYLSKIKHLAYRQKQERSGNAETVTGNHVTTERARDMLGTDFLGVEEGRKLEDILQRRGQDVEFKFDELPPIPYTEKDLQVAKKMGEMLVLRPNTMLKGGKNLPITLMNYQELFRFGDPLGNKDEIFRRFETGSHNNFYTDENFAFQPGEIELGWELVKKGVLDESNKRKTWHEQEALLQQYGEELRSHGATSTQIRRRTVMKSVWDTVLYYANTGLSLLEYDLDWGQSHSSHGNVGVGLNDKSGLVVLASNTRAQPVRWGVVPSR